MREFERNYNQDFFGFWFLVKKMRNISSAIFYGIIRLVGYTEIKTQRQRNAAKATVYKSLKNAQNRNMRRTASTNQPSYDRSGDC
jgi:hypothetical protein